MNILHNLVVRKASTNSCCRIKSMAKKWAGVANSAPAFLLMPDHIIVRCDVDVSFLWWAAIAVAVMIKWS